MTSSSGERHCPPGCFVCPGLAAVAPQSAVAIVWARTQKFPCNCAPCRRNLRIGRVRSLRSSSSRRTWGIPRPELAYCYRNRNVCREAPHGDRIFQKFAERTTGGSFPHHHRTNISPRLRPSSLAPSPSPSPRLSSSLAVLQWNPNYLRIFCVFLGLSSAFLLSSAFVLFCFSASLLLLL